MLSKNKYIEIFESLNITTTNKVCIHHPITTDLVWFNVKQTGKEKILLTVPNDSPYFGQPDFWFSKKHIISVA